MKNTQITPALLLKMGIGQFVEESGLDLNQFALEFLDRRKIRTVGELLKTRVSLEADRIWRSLGGLRDALKERGFCSDDHYFLIVPV